MGLFVVCLVVAFFHHSHSEMHPSLYGSKRDCGSVQGTCEDDSSIMYAWARNAPPTKLPKNVGFKVGRNSGTSYFVLQIHYGDVSAFRERQPFIAGIYLLMSVDTIIPPGKKVTNADVACEYDSYPLYPFAFRTHTHSLGKVVSGYRVRDGKWSLIGRQSPQLPQAFYPANKEVTVRYGDTIAARCVFTGEGRTSKTYIGGTSSDEMCNFYMMYYMDSKHANPFMNCMETGSKELFEHIPAEANVPIAVSPGHMHAMMGMGNNAGMEIYLIYVPYCLILGLNYEFNGTSSDEMCNFYMMYYMDSKHANPFMNCMETGSKELFEHIPAEANVPIAVSPGHMHAMMGMGNNAGMEIYLIYVPSFNSQARYQQRFLGPIQQSAILVVDPANGRILKASGRNMFYLPHGITTDKDNNYWVTDVALHQGSSDRRRRTPFQIPHSLVFLPDRKEVCVADRENGRIQCFIAETGEFVKEIKNEEFGGEVFAIAYSPAEDGLIFAVNGDSSHHFTPLRGFVLGYSTKQILDSFSPTQKEFKMPHDIVVTKDGTVFVGDAGNKSVFKFSAEKLHRSVKKAGIEVQELEEVEAFVQAKLRPHLNISKVATIKEKQTVAEKTHPLVEVEPRKSAPKADRKQSVLPAVVVSLLLILLLVIVFLGFFMCWSKNKRNDIKLEPHSMGGVLGKIRGKAVGTLNLGKFFASHKGYSRQGFDQLSTEGSDQERNVEDSSDSDTEEYSAPPPRPPPPQSSS
ncbi:PREDICTED: peptidyl-glycine alpha-amidating monooxygenase [Cyprinodon variegatus]|uniref:peptidyl-glycine alpha-amidating monooxygenase n=1 Tax=Cyprinodon variegatus TaxID=28743 RepID=UPI000742A679|nr:PREDICTED: peptidyl-glycine alpha-amidating monooxygenase [Cyprinodon variegatus]